MKPLVERPIYNYDVVLCQWIENGNIITWATKVFNKIEYLIPNSSAVFKIKLKDKRTFLHRLFDFGKYKKYWRKHLIQSQINKTNAAQPNPTNQKI